MNIFGTNMEKGNGGSPVSEGFLKKESMKYRDNKEDSDSIDSDTSNESDSHPENETLTVSLAQEETPVSQGSTEPDAKRIGKTSISEKEREIDMADLKSIDDGLQDLHDSLMTRPIEYKKVDDPVGLRVHLRPHQQHALAWLLWREQQPLAGGILADDMGPGKILTMISLIIASNARDSERHRGGTLVVCRNVRQLEHWEHEIQNRCRRNTLKVMVHHDKTGATAAEALSSKDVMITTCDILRFENECKKGIMYSTDWERVILDEAHIIRNHTTKISEAVCAISARKRWALTGTLDNINTKHLYSIMKFFKCAPCDNIQVWKRSVKSSQRLSDIMRSLKLGSTMEEL